MNLIEREKNIISDFNFLESWDQKYEFLIDLAKYD